MITAALLLAVALLLGGRRPGGRLNPGRITAPDADLPGRAGDPLAFAASLEVLAACLHSGMAVSAAAAATASSAPPQLAAVLRRAADMLALGSDPASAWSSTVPQDRHVEALLRLARRSSASGTALAQGVGDLAARSRDDAAADARAAAERASVLIAGPLGLCYLPAFVCLGIVPVVAGLAGDVLQSGVL